MIIEKQQCDRFQFYRLTLFVFFHLNDLIILKIHLKHSLNLTSFWFYKENLHTCIVPKKRKKKGKKNSLLVGIYLFYILAGYDCYDGPFLTSFDKFNLVILHIIIHNNAKEVYLNAFNSNPKHMQILFSICYSFNQFWILKLRYTLQPK